MLYRKLVRLPERTVPFDVSLSPIVDGGTIDLDKAFLDQDTMKKAMIT